MTVAPGAVYDLDPRAAAGPWSDGRHPGLIVAVSQEGATLVPLTSSRGRGPARAFCYQVTDGGGAVTLPIYAHCHHVTTLALDEIKRGRHLGRLPHTELGPVRDRLAMYLKLRI